MKMSTLSNLICGCPHEKKMYLQNAVISDLENSIVAEILNSQSAFVHQTAMSSLINIPLSVALLYL